MHYKDFKLPGRQGLKKLRKLLGFCFPLFSYESINRYHVHGSHGEKSPAPGLSNSPGTAVHVCFKSNKSHLKKVKIKCHHYFFFASAYVY